MKDRDKYIYHRSSMQTEESQPEDKRMMSETGSTEFLAFFRWHEGKDFSVCIGDRCLIIFLTCTYDERNIIYYS